MERTKEENDVIYISESKKNINKYIDEGDYRLAFGLLLFAVDRLDDGKQKNDFISYYLSDFFSINPSDGHLNPNNITPIMA
jgi:hypothetical protein